MIQPTASDRARDADEAAAVQDDRVPIGQTGEGRRTFATEVAKAQRFRSLRPNGMEQSRPSRALCVGYIIKHRGFPTASWGMREIARVRPIAVRSTRRTG
ncbi:MAG: hypothetical protein JO051_14530 [Acidobacteriaceae bacterium]|nr:hypothetical protein [Acidobacteriaceae bacterium]